MTRRRCLAGGGGLLLATLVAGCRTGPVRADNAVDPRIYAACQDPEGAAAWQRAQSALLRGDDAAALPDLRACAERCPLLVRAHRTYQDVARRIGGDAERAMVAFYLGDRSGTVDSEVDATGAPTVRDYLRARLADTSYAQSNALQAMLARDPSFAWAHLSLARVNRRQGRLLQAVDMFGAAIVNDASLHEARLERAQVLAELGREEEAAVDYRAYLRGRPDDEDAMHAFVTLLLYRLERTDEALALLDQLEQLHPGSTSLRMDRAAAMWRAKQLREAVEMYLGVLREEPRRARAALNIGYLYYEVLGRDEVSRRRFWPAARAAFRMYLELAQPTDGHEQFERTLAVPYRLEVIAELLGPDDRDAVSLDQLDWPEGA
jgi:tetratricopeptide (TPR) repeat protein